MTDPSFAQTLALVAVMLVGHFIADFLLQSHWMALNKSKRLDVLGAHVAIHLVTLTWLLGLLVPFFVAVRVGFVNALVHAIIDWNIWRGFRRYAEKKSAGYSPYDDHWFWVTIGADQLLHGLTLVGALWAAKTF